MPAPHTLLRLYADREAAWEALRLADLGTPEASQRACEHFQECRAKVRAATLAAETATGSAA